VKSTETRHESKTKILDAALRVIRSKGYGATRIEDICDAAGLTKGSFFHHFGSKEELAIAAADYWGEMTTALFAAAPYHGPSDPLERLLAYVDFRKAILQGTLPEFTCLAGTMTQEVYDTHPAIRRACEHTISGHAATLVPDIEAAIRQRGIEGDWTAESLALFTQAAIQGAFILAKAKNGAEVAGDCIRHLRRYLELLFHQPQHKKEMTSMNLTQEPEIVTWPETHYVFLEKVGPFMETAPQAWGEVHGKVPAIEAHNQITGYMSLYKVGPKVYRAGVSVATPPAELPEGLKYERFPGGKYSRFVLTGPYSNLPEASGRAFKLVEEKHVQLRDDFNIENYVTDPRKTPADQLITEILFPTA
jgi:TetR/AcrR family transcriptional repressor of nem operon